MNQKLPRHIAIVMDGNGRWAENRGLPRIEGHRAGMQVVKEVVNDCLYHSIQVLSLFAFSSENWSRPAGEVDFLMQLFLTALDQEIQSLHAQGVCLRFIGQRCQLSSILREKIQSAEALTVNNTALTLNLAVNYSGKWDIVNAAKTIAHQVMEAELVPEEINESIFEKALSTQTLPEPDLLIRTSGEQRISNFFLWQLAYTELYFSQVLWPDFTREAFEAALRSFSIRERRYGLISEQLK